MSREIKECERCGDTFRKLSRHSKRDWEDRRFCSASCANKSRDVEPIHIRFWRYFEKGPKGLCWEWMGAKDDKNYGTISTFRGEPPYKAHRLSYEMFCGPIPENMLIRHRCDNPICVNPHHLEIGTQFDNMQDASKRGRLNPNSLLNLKPGHDGFHGAGPRTNKEIRDEQRR